MANKIADYVIQYDLDGVDVDYEVLSSIPCLCIPELKTMFYRTLLLSRLVAVRNTCLTIDVFSKLPGCRKRRDLVDLPYQTTEEKTPSRYVKSR